MIRRAAVLLAFSILQLVFTASTQAAEPVMVQVRSDTAERERIQLQATLQSLPTEWSKWKALRKRKVSYIVKQGSSGLILPDPCDTLPIAVTVVDNELRNAVYAASAGACKAGQPARRKTSLGERRLFTPDEFFRRISRAREQLRCYEHLEPRGCVPTTLRVTYDSRLGLPTEMADYSDELSDYYWSLSLEDISIEP